MNISGWRSASEVFLEALFVILWEVAIQYSFYHEIFNTFVPNAPFLYLLKTSENRKVL